MKIRKPLYTPLFIGYYIVLLICLYSVILKAPIEQYCALTHHSHHLHHTLNQKIALMQSDILIQKKLAQIKKDHPQLFYAAQNNNSMESTLSVAAQNTQLTVIKITPDHKNESKNKNNMFSLELNGPYLFLFHFVQTLNALPYPLTITHLAISANNQIDMKIESPK